MKDIEIVLKVKVEQETKGHERIRQRERVKEE